MSVCGKKIKKNNRGIKVYKESGFYIFFIFLCFLLLEKITTITNPNLKDFIMVFADNFFFVSLFHFLYIFRSGC